MKDLADALAACTQLAAAGRRGVLATVVATRGSTYRRPGARMVVAEDGASWGMVGGGCADTDLMERARRVLEGGEPEHVIYDTTAPDDLVWGLGLGCNGVVEILLEPLPRDRPPAALAAAGEAADADRPVVLATVVEAPAGGPVQPAQHLVTGGSRATVDEIGDPELAAAVLADAGEVLAGAGSRLCSYPVAGGEASVFLELVQPPVSLLVVGAGADAVPLVDLGTSLGWRVAVADHRPAFARPERFPGAHAVLLADPHELAGRLAIGPRTAVVVLTHSYRHDGELLRRLLPSPAFYVGVIGPRRRRDALLKDLAAEGFEPTPEQLEHLYGPIGLDVGAETAAEIALAVVAEIQAALTGRPGGPLRERDAAIHPRTTAAAGRR